METLSPRSAEIIGEFQKPLSSIMYDSTMSVETKITKSSCWPRKMYLAAFAALLSAAAVGLVSGYSAPATYDMEIRRSSRVKPNADEVTWIGSIVSLGSMVGGLLAGPLTDKIGRKNTLIFNVIPFASGWLTICYANTVTVIVIGRILCGIGVSLAVVTTSVYCVEISTPEVRGILGSSVQGFLVIGNLLSGVIGSVLYWDYLALTGAIFSVFAMICFLPMPESPRWYLAKNKLKDAIATMDYLQSGHVDATKECNEIYEDLKNQPQGKLSFKECLHPTIYKPALICVMLIFFQMFSGTNAVFFYSSHIFEESKNFLDPKKATIILGAVQVVATIPTSLIVDKAGRKLLLVVSGTLMALSLIVLGIYYYISSINSNFQNTYNWLPLACLNLNVIAYSIGYGPLPNLLSAEMTPVRARTTVSGLTLLSVGIFGFILNKTFSDLQASIKLYGTFWFYSCFAILSVLFTILVVPETKGKKLEDIENLFYKRKQDEKPISISVI